MAAPLGRGAPRAVGARVSDGEPIIRLEGVTKRFGAKVAVSDVTVDVPRGRCLGWLGPNGSGKTTLIRCMLGLARASSGTIQVRGHRIPREADVALRRVGGIVEEPRFYPYLSGRGNLEVWAGFLRGDAHTHIDGALERVGLAANADRKVKAYSMGMRQRLGVARSLLTDPELLILDEPSNGLDPSGMAAFREMIRFVRRAGRAHGVHLVAPPRRGREDRRRHRDRPRGQARPARVGRRARRRGEAGAAPPRRRRRPRGGGRREGSRS